MRSSLLRARRASLLLAVITVAACERFDDRQLTLIASNHTWRVSAVGDLAQPPLGSHNVVRFVAERNGSVFTTGHLCKIGALDDSFAAQFPVRQWVQPNLLRLGRQALPAPRWPLRLRNENVRAIRWLKLEDNFETFLVFDIPTDGNAQLDLLMSSEGAYYLFVIGEYDDGSSVGVLSEKLPESKGVSLVFSATRTRVEIQR